jgi:hypothetical protein
MNIELRRLRRTYHRIDAGDRVTETFSRSGR